MTLEEAKKLLEEVKRDLRLMRAAHLTVSPRYKSLQSIQDLLVKKIMSGEDHDSP